MSKDKSDKKKSKKDSHKKHQHYAEDDVLLAVNPTKSSKKEDLKDKNHKDKASKDSKDKNNKDSDQKEKDSSYDKKQSDIYQENISAKYRVENGKKFDLSECPVSPGFDVDEKEAAEILEDIVKQIAKQQMVLYADNKWSLLLVFQAMDAAGKDSTIKNILSGVNPQGIEVFSFKRPSYKELSHDFLWRTTCDLPERGNIGVFNRSYYEETLIARVHPDILESEPIPKKLVTKHIWDERLESIKDFEKHISRNGVVVLKFYLHISKEEQKSRLLARIEDPDKNWKFDKNDLYERKFWNDYMHAYEETIKHTATEYAPWYVIPGNSKPYARIVVADAVLQALKSLKLQYPSLHPTEQSYLEECRKLLENEE
ncbi:PPK2 family polyphosphate kinase [Pelistega sp. MC2]|nr:PPK2 family polyphosphate kinase [Pelistega sp. MC2]